MGLSPQVWGKAGWNFIHSVALSYPTKPTKEDKENYLSFLKSLQYVLPCPTCANNFKDKLEKNPPNLENRKSLFKWTVDAHNEVNKEHNKKIISYQEAYDLLFDEIRKQNEMFEKGLKKSLIIEDVKTILPFMGLSILFAYIITRKTK
jgi:hypothetical protein